jgi:hypothetical protein
MLGQKGPGTVQSTSTVQNSTVPPHDHLGIDTTTAEALGIGYAAKGLMKGYVAVPVRLIAQRLADRVHRNNRGEGAEGIPPFPEWLHFPRRVRKKSPAGLRGFSLIVVVVRACMWAHGPVRSALHFL